MFFWINCFEILITRTLLSSVRKDLMTTFQRIFENDTFARLDWVVIETTGLADPAPLIQTLYMDKGCTTNLRLDGVLTVVDCKHFPLHLKGKKQGLLDDGRSGYEQEGVHGGLPEAVKQVPHNEQKLLQSLITLLLT